MFSWRTSWSSGLSLTALSGRFSFPRRIGSRPGLPCKPLCARRSIGITSARTQQGGVPTGCCGRGRRCGCCCHPTASSRPTTEPSGHAATAHSHLAPRALKPCPMRPCDRAYDTSTLSENLPHVAFTTTAETQVKTCEQKCERLAGDRTRR